MATRYITLPRHAVVRYRRKQKQDALARALYETRRPGRTHHNKANEDRRRSAELLGRPFVMWDGEGPADAGYALFGNSAGDEICHPHLGTEECLRLIVNRASSGRAIHFWFGGNYDVSMILWQLPHRHLRNLQIYTRTVWRGYKLEHIPHKWFKVTYGSVSCKIYDVRSFFSGNYQSALRDFDIGTSDELDRIERGKADRDIFVWDAIEEIKEYWKLELKLGPLLMQKLRQLFYEAGYVPTSWHGPGALARMALKRHHIYDCMKRSPFAVQEAAQYAFAGGRFELPQAGHIQGKVYNADIHSAYPHFATHLPNLNRGSWRHTRNYEAGKFAVWHIRYDAKPDNSRIFPLFRRLSNGCVVWPHRVEGWYWSPEAHLVHDDPDANIIEGWIFDEDDPADRPFSFLGEYYDKRMVLKDAGNPAEYTFKLIINAIYGQLAQRAGWDRKHHTAPKSHQLEWAGYITSACRAEIYNASAKCGHKLISIDTDGIYATAPIDSVDYGTKLGQWDSTEYVDGVFWQSGIYGLKHENHKKTCPPDCDGWGKPKSRGIKKGSYKINILLECVKELKPLVLNKRTFITYGLAEIYGWHLHNTWQDDPHTYHMGGAKRAHFPMACPNVCTPPMHRLLQWEPAYGVTPTDDGWSRKHKLPWLDDWTDDDETNLKITELFNANHLDPDDLWVIPSSQQHQEG